MASLPDLILSVLDDVEPLMRAAFDAVGGTPEPGSALDQVFLLNGREAVVDYLKHAEPGLAVDHLIGRGTSLDVGEDTRRRLTEATRLTRLGNGGYGPIAADGGSPAIATRGTTDVGRASDGRAQ